MTATPGPETYRQTVQRLAQAQKAAAPGAPPYSIYVNRRLGRFLAAWAFRAGLTPDQVTALSATVTFSGIVAFAALPLHWWTGLVITVLLALGYALDSADGQVARLRGGGSPAGEWLDHVVDSAKVVSLHLAVAIGAARGTDLDQAWLLVPLGFAVVASVEFFTMILNEQLHRAAGVTKRAADVAPRYPALRRLLLLPTDYGLLCWLPILLIWPMVFAVAYALLFIANAGHLALALRKWRGDVVRLSER